MPPMQLWSQLAPQRERRAKEEAGREPPYRVIVHNDDVTPMEFVTHILLTVFLVPAENAVTIMYTAHLNGSSYVQTLPKAEARKRINKAHFAARMQNFPLTFTMEPE
ncbi:MAG TPA: ATP-dependent Clp protease adaptor ClpS [Anaerolineales bacterium]|nr:ATP-dependent Clp protease adaptor ClpS [Anaerolineales bacterium]